MPRYKVPIFNRGCNVWRNGNPTTNPPDLQTDCQLTAGRRSITPYVTVPGGPQRAANMHLLLPAGTDVRDGKAAGGADTIECPAGSGRFYDVLFVDDIGFGFLNEHRFAMLQGTNWPQPFPPMNVQYPLPVFNAMGSGGSLGVAVAGVGIMLNPPVAGIMVFSMAAYNQPVPPVVTWGGTVMNLSQQFAVAPVGGVGADLFQWWIPVVPGILLFQVAYGGGLLAAIQYELCVFGNTWTPTSNLASAQGVAPAIPTITPVTVTSYGEAIPAAFTLLAQAGVAAYGIPWLFSDVPVFDMIGGVLCGFASGHYGFPATGPQTCTLPLDTSAGWGGVATGFM